MLKIAEVVKDKKTQEGLDLTGKDAILEHLAKWCERKCKEHSIDPGSEAMQALLQQAHWHEENKEDHARTRGTVEKAAKAVLGAQVAMHATVEDIASFLGVEMDKKRRKNGFSCDPCQACVLVDLVRVSMSLGVWWESGNLGAWESRSLLGVCWESGSNANAHENAI